MSRADPVARQRAFYDAGAHTHLRAQGADRYAEHIVAELVAQAGIGPHHRVLEVGAGFGRFTFALLSRCAAVVALDLSQRMLDDLERERARRGIAPERCVALCRDVHALTPEAVEPVDFVVGFFILHHLPDFRRTVADLATHVAPGGGMAFVEPNRRNPLYPLQLTCCPDMHWREEKGLYRIGERGLAAALRAAGLGAVRTHTFGFFPPQIVNRSAAAARLERRLERARLLRPILPFVVASGQRG